MKGACVSALEAAQVLAESGDFAGELAIVAIGLHEAPGGRGEDLTHLVHEQGFTADYAVVCELTQPDKIVVAHMGQATAEITISRPGMPTHELQTPAGTPHPLLAAARVVEAIRRRSEELAETEHPWVGPGDVLRRRGARRRLLQPLPDDAAGSSARAAGRPATRSTPSRRSTAPCSRRSPTETGCEIELDLRLVRDAYGIDPEHALGTRVVGCASRK